MAATIKVAACQLQPELGNLAENLARAERLVEEAFQKGVRWVILPEFFPSGMAYHPSMLHAALPLEGPALKLCIDMARRYRGHVGGSFASIKGNDRYNTFIVVRPDGTYGAHDKSIPTWWENCYYLKGADDEGVVETDGARVGMAICWELALWRTARRLKDKVDFVVAGSCWFATPKTNVLKRLVAEAQDYNFALIKEAPRRLARVLGVPVVHASAVGPFKGNTPLLPMSYDSFFQGESQIVDATGKTLALRHCDEGPGVITAEIEPCPIAPPEPMGAGLWIRLNSTPAPIRLAFTLANGFFTVHGKLYYQWSKLRGFRTPRSAA